MTRAAFIYLSGDTDDFAQCSTCRLWVSDDDRCILHGPKIMVGGDDSCSFWFSGSEIAARPAVSVTPEESGLVHRRVQCHRCLFYEDGPKCGLYAKLNKRLGDEFDLDEKIEPHACCNAWMPKGPSRPERRYGAGEG